MKKAYILLSSALLIGLSLQSFAQGIPVQASQEGLKLPMHLSLNTNSLLKLINQNIVQNWQKYYNLDQKKELPTNNLQLLKITSNYDNLATNYVFSGGESLNAPNQLPASIYCLTAGVSPFCQQVNAGHISPGYAMHNSQQIKDYNFQGQANYTPSVAYIKRVIFNTMSKPNLTDNSNNLTAATAIFNSLNEVMTTYTSPGSKAVKSGGKTTYVPIPSPMQSLHAAVNAPFKSKYFVALTTASAPQTLRLNNELLAESNAMKYKIIYQNQTRTILETSLLSEEIQNNQLQKANLATNKAILAALNKRAGK